jgi:hypothetical protein
MPVLTDSAQDTHGSAKMEDLPVQIGPMIGQVQGQCEETLCWGTPSVKSKMVFQINIVIGTEQ